MREEGPNRNKK